MEKPIPTAELVDRLAALPNLAEIPRDELDWLGDHGNVELRQAGKVVAPKDKQFENLWIILSGHVSVRVDRGVGPRRVIGWCAGITATSRSNPARGGPSFGSASP